MVATMKDEKKKEKVMRIGQNLNEANERTLNHFLSFIEQIEKVLLNIGLRTDKASAAGNNVTAVKVAITEAQNAIMVARKAIQDQSVKVYGITIKSEDTVKDDVSAARDSLRNDLEAVKTVVQKIRDAVQKAAVSLAQIPRVDVYEGNEGTSTSTASSTTQ